MFAATLHETLQKNDAQHNAEHPDTLALNLEMSEKERQLDRHNIQATTDDLRARLDRSEEHLSGLLSGSSKRRSWWLW